MMDADRKGIRLSRRFFAAATAALATATCGPHVRCALASPVIVIDQPVALIDAAVAIELRGFPPATARNDHSAPDVSEDALASDRNLH